MSDEEIKNLGEQIWNQYWSMTVVSGLANKISDDIAPLLKHFFRSGFLEGFKTKEEISKGE